MPDLRAEKQPDMPALFVHGCCVDLDILDHFPEINDALHAWPRIERISSRKLASPCVML